MDKDQMNGLPSGEPEQKSDAQASGDATAGACNGGRGRCCRRQEPRGKLYCHNWLEDVPGGFTDFDIVEVQFKNTRKGFFRNSTGLQLAIGDIVAVESSPGHDIGEVTLTGRLVERQMRKANVRPGSDIKRVFRKARPSDLEKWAEARAKENDTMIRARRIADDLNLNMKIGDVEYQGDGNKAIFYYIADERVDFRQLIKVLADTFKVRVEMKQIGARQEAGRIGGIGPCGRPLCCASWMSNFVSVGTAAARFQNLSLNPQKLAGQCAKLKCCLNFEVDTYAEASRKLPPKEARLETADSTYFHFKTDVFKMEITYSTDKHVPANLVTIPAERAFEVIGLNKHGEKPLTLLPEGSEKPGDKKKVVDLVEQESLTRFDKAKKKRKKKPKTAAPDKTDRSDRSDKPEKAEKPAKADRPAKPRNNSNRRPDRNRRQDRDDKPAES